MSKKEKLPANKDKKHNKTGRPRKFEGPTQNFYVTLPTEVVQRLRGVDEHLATAIVKLSAGMGLVTTADLENPDLVQGLLPVAVTPESWIISLPNDALNQISGIQLVPVDGRWLLTLAAGQDPERLELILRDHLEISDLRDEARGVIEQVVHQLRLGRQQGGIAALQLILYSR